MKSQFLVGTMELKAQTIRADWNIYIIVSLIYEITTALMNTQSRYKEHKEY